MKVIRSPLFYVGDKAKLVPQIVPHFPEDISLLIEPFVGGGSISINTYAKSYLLNDFNAYVSGLHSWLLEQDNFDYLAQKIEGRIHEVGLKSSFFGDVIPQALKTQFPKTYFAHQNREAYESLRLRFNQETEKDFLDFYLLLIFGFNRMIRFNGRGEFNVPVGNVDFNSNVAEALKNYLNWANKSTIRVKTGDYRQVIEIKDLPENSFIYFDPPYLIAQAEYNKSWGVSEELEFFGYLDSLTDANVKWAFSNVITYKDQTNKLLSDWAKKYQVVNLQSNYISYHDNGEKKPREVLVKNYE